MPTKFVDFSSLYLASLQIYEQIDITDIHWFIQLDIKLFIVLFILVGYKAYE